MRFTLQRYLILIILLVLFSFSCIYSLFGYVSCLIWVFMLLDRFSNCHKVLIDKEGVFNYSEWTWSSSSWLSKSSKASITSYCTDVSTSNMWKWLLSSLQFTRVDDKCEFFKAMQRKLILSSVLPVWTSACSEDELTLVESCFLQSLLWRNLSLLLA